MRKQSISTKSPKPTSSRDSAANAGGYAARAAAVKQSSPQKTEPDDATETVRGYASGICLALDSHILMQSPIQPLFSVGSASVGGAPLSQPSADPGAVKASAKSDIDALQRYAKQPPSYRCADVLCHREIELHEAELEASKADVGALQQRPSIRIRPLAQHDFGSFKDLNKALTQELQTLDK